VSQSAEVSIALDAEMGLLSGRRVTDGMKSPVSANAKPNLATNGIRLRQFQQLGTRLSSVVG
jgi:hypothetical protein